MMDIIDQDIEKRKDCFFFDCFKGCDRKCELFC